jgi:cbb3-type cytochrome oxidase cytochrome c subunit
MKLQNVLLVLAAFALAVFTFGCNLSSSTSSSTSPNGQTQGPNQPVFDTESGPHAAGKKALVASGCMRCHTVNGARAGGAPGPGGPGPGGPGARAPDLGKVGSVTEHNVDWFIKYVRDPKSTKPNSRMPPQPEAKINDADLRAVAEYLASLK